MPAQPTKQVQKEVTPPARSVSSTSKFGRLGAFVQFFCREEPHNTAEPGGGFKYTHSEEIRFDLESSR